MLSSWQSYIGRGWGQCACTHFHSACKVIWRELLCSPPQVFLFDIHLSQHYQHNFAHACFFTIIVSHPIQLPLNYLSQPSWGRINFTYCTHAKVVARQKEMKSYHHGYCAAAKPFGHCSSWTVVKQGDWLWLLEMVCLPAQHVCGYVHGTSTAWLASGRNEQDLARVLSVVSGMPLRSWWQIFEDSFWFEFN